MFHEQHERRFLNARDLYSELEKPTDVAMSFITFIVIIIIIQHFSLIMQTSGQTAKVPRDNTSA